MERARGSKVSAQSDSQLAQELLVICKELAQTGGKNALAGRLAGLKQVETKTTSTDMVTEFDRATEKYIVDAIRSRRPSDSIIGEEGASYSGTSGVTWCIDPIDGTTNFLYALPSWGVSIGVSDSHGPLVGVVFIPALNETFSAIRGQGAFLNDKVISCNETTDISKALVCTGFSYSAEQRTIQSQRIAKFIHKIRDIRRFGAASIDICFVACGRLDAYFEENLHEWDIAAAELIAIESGAKSGNFSGDKSSPKEILITCPKIFDQLSEFITSSSSPANSPHEKLNIGNLEIIPSEGRVTLDNAEVQLTKTEFLLLCELATNINCVFSREELRERVWGSEYVGDDRLVDVHIRRLRTKIETDAANPKHLVTVRGLGYRLQP